jgi:anti-sigma regulatory factor (Ser/Thr protein kinase)
MSAGEHRVFQARLAILAQTGAFVEAFCRRHSVARADALRLTLIVEELFSNTVAHGHGGDCDAEIGLTLTAADGEVSLLYEDAAPPFDPLAAPLPASEGHAADATERPVGGLGVLLVRKLVRDARYAYENGRNRLWLALARAG